MKILQQICNWNQSISLSRNSSHISQFHFFAVIWTAKYPAIYIYRTVILITIYFCVLRIVFYVSLKKILMPFNCVFVCFFFFLLFHNNGILSEFLWSINKKYRWFRKGSNNNLPMPTKCILCDNSKRKNMNNKTMEINCVKKFGHFFSVNSDSLRSI